MQLGIYADIEQARDLPNDQFDFIEENIQTLLVPEADEATFQKRLEIVRSLDKPVSAANRLLPADLHPIGPSVNEPRLHRWLETVMRRSEAVGVKTIVWGSGVSRRVPEGFSFDKAREQFDRAVAYAAPLAERHGVTIVIEPVARWDSNFIMSLADGARVVEAASHPSVKLLADFYHMEWEGEPATQMVRYKDILEHVHLSEFGMDRGQPGRAGTDLRTYLRALKESGYQKGLVIESFWKNLHDESRSGLAELRKQMRDVGLEA